MAVDFSDLLNKSIEDIEAPRPLPSGTYAGLITAPPSEDSFTVTDEKTGEKREVRVLIVTVALQEPMPGVDAELLERAGGLRRNDGKPKEQQYRFYVDEQSLYKLKKFCASCGVSGNTLAEQLLALPGSEVLVDLTMVPNPKEDGEFFNRVTRIVGTAKS